jgi:hypothetical protein
MVAGAVVGGAAVVVLTWAAPAVPSVVVATWAAATPPPALASTPTKASAAIGGR